MKLRVYFKPGRIVLGLAVASFLFWLIAWELMSWSRWLCVVGALFYSNLTLLSFYALVQCQRLEHWVEWDKSERLLILAPHQDDCVICAGGIGIRNQQLGGETYVVYLVQDDKPSMAEVRKAEAIAAWAIAGVPANHLLHLDLLPKLYERAPEQLQKSALELGRLIEAISPTVLILPLFEGGHIHHDLLNHVVTSGLKTKAGIKVFEAPEYSPYVSLRWTPHRIIALCGRWLGFMVAYYGPPDGIDDRSIYKVCLNAQELTLKREMLATFVSQNGDSLALTRAYPDRLIEWRPRPYRAGPFDVAASYYAFVCSLQRWFPARLVQRILPCQIGTYGREPEVTDLSKELRVN